MQAGATTGLIAASLDLRLPFCLIGPTRKNVNEVMKSAAKYTDREELREWAEFDPLGLPLYTLPTSLDCPLVKAEIAACPDKKRIPIFFPTCKTCGRSETCPPYNFLLHGMQMTNIEGIGITRASLKASLHSEERDRIQGIVDESNLSWGSLRLRMIRKFCKVFFDDECHTHEIPESKRITIMDITNSCLYNFKSIYRAVLEANGSYELEGEEFEGFVTGEKKYGGRYGHVVEVIRLLDDLLNSSELLETIQNVRERMGNPGHRRELLTGKVKNPHWLDLDAPGNIGAYASIINQLHRMYEDINNGSLVLEREKVLDLLHIFYVVCAEYVTVQIYPDASVEYADLVAIDYRGEELFKKFMQSRLDGNHRGFLLSATPSDFRYTCLASNGKMRDLFFNNGGDPEELRGDPNGSCGSQLIIADTWRLTGRGRNSILDRLDYIVDAIKNIVEQHGVSNCAVIAVSARQGSIIRQALGKADVPVPLVDYYRSADSVSTTYEKDGKQIRIGILVGAAETPAHTMDAFSKTASESAKKRIIDIYQATYQTTGRFKSSSGLPSVIYCLGIDALTVENFTTWGTEYDVSVDLKAKRDRYTVKVKKAIARPRIEHATDKYISQLLGSQHMDIGNVEQSRCEVFEQKSLAPQVCTSLPLLYYTNYPHTVGHIIKLPDLPQKLLSLLYEYRERLEKYSFRYYQMFATDTGIFLSRYTTKHVQSWGSHDFEWENFQSFSDYANGRPLEIECNSREEEGAVATDAGTIETPKNYPNDYPLDDFDQLQDMPIDADYVVPEDRYTPESWAAWLEHLDAQIVKARISPALTYVNSLDFLHEVFGTRPDLYYRQEWINGKMGYVAMRRSPYVPLKEQYRLYERHFAGTTTLGMPCIMEAGMVKWLCFDIDAHQRADDTGVTLIKKRYTAETKTFKLLRWLHDHNIPYILEKSGSTASYHIWISLKPVEAKLAMLFGRSIARAAGVTDIEINPKQSKPGSKGSGNQVKLPWGKHQLHGGWSKLFIAGKWTGVGDFTSITHRAIDISEFNTDAPKLTTIKEALANEPVLYENGVGYVIAESVEYGCGGTPGIRPIISWLLSQTLTGSEGHSARIYIVREYLNAGYTPEEIAPLFSKQPDYDYEITLGYIRGLAAKDFGNVAHSTIWQNCPELAAMYENATGRSLETREAVTA